MISESMAAVINNPTMASLLEEDALRIIKGIKKLPLNSEEIMAVMHAFNVILTRNAQSMEDK